MDFTNCLTCDTETYKNYFLIMFKKVTTGEVLYFEKFNDSELPRANIYHILNKYTIITFNGIKYDSLVIEAALSGMTNAGIKKVNDLIIPPKKPGEKKRPKGLQPWEVRKQMGFPKLHFDHIDVMEVAPLVGSLKVYAGRLHAKKMQDLPIDPTAIITEKTRKKMIPYCENDNDNTWYLCKRLEKELDLRCQMGKDYDIDLRSKSDAQIAEAVIKHELKKHFGITPKKPSVPYKTKLYYQAPTNLKFETETMQEIFSLFKSEYFIVGKSGHVEIKTGLYQKDQDGEFLLNKKGNKIEVKHLLNNKKFKIGSTTYKVGMGGLHSCEKKTAHVKGKYILKEYDVASFYPFIILNNKLFPKHIGEAFLKIYRSLVKLRLKAKKEGNKIVADSLKITINGLFGKLASSFSFVYSPDLMMQVTITGQLSLLMLVERLEEKGISVVSGNTDGIVVKMLPEQEDLVEDIVFDWELDTDYTMESTEYLGLYSRDVNNYIAISKDKIKTKGAYADTQDKKGVVNLHINPTNSICTDAVKAYLQHKTPITKTIKECNDITKFTSIRTVNGGALKDGQEIGKVIRWYYGKNELTDIYYKTSGNKVPRSDGAVPLMDLPNQLPDDIDYNWYIEESNKFLKEIGAV